MFDLGSYSHKGVEMVLTAGFFQITKRASRPVWALVLREIATGYGRIPGGYLWALAEPIAGITILTSLFSLGFHAPPLGNSFALFYASGLLPLLIFTDLSSKLAQAVNFSRPLLFYPRVTAMDALFARFLVGATTQLLILILVLGGMLRLGAIETWPPPIQVLQAFSLALLPAFGFGALNCVVITLLPVWQKVWSIAMRPLFLGSAVFYTYGDVPLPYREWLWYNPIVHAVGTLRSALYPGYVGDHISPLYVASLSLTSLAAGLWLLHRLRARLNER